MADFLTDGGPEPTQSTPIDVAPPRQLPPGDAHAAGRAEAGEDDDDDDDDDFLFSGAQPASLGASGAFSSVGSGGDGGFGLGATRLVGGGGGAANGGRAAGAPVGAGASIGTSTDGAAATTAAGGGRSSYFGGGVAYRGGASFLDDSDAGTDSDDDGDGPGGGGGGGDGGGGGTYLSGTGLNGLSGGRRRPFRPQTIKHFILGDVLGEGSYAKVREGIDSASLRIVAVKVIDLRFLRKIRGGPENLKREVAIMKALKKHPNIIELIDVIDEERKDKKYIVVELANGCTLQELLASAPDSRIPASQMKPLLRQLMHGLAYIHDRNVVHRDIKPANIMLTSRSELKVSDFGVAEFLDKYVVTDSVSRTSGTPAFQAPEIASGAADYSGRKVDVWAAGVTLFYCLTGRIPFEATTLMGMFTKISDGSFDTPTFVDAGAVDLLQGMLTVEFEARLSVEDVLAHPWLADDEPVVAPDDSPQPRVVPQPCRASRILKIVSAMYEDDGDDGDGGGGGGAGGGGGGGGGPPSGPPSNTRVAPPPARPAAASTTRSSLDGLPRPAALNSVVPERCSIM